MLDAFGIYVIRPASNVFCFFFSFFFLAIFERLRNILHESEVDKRVQYMIEVMFAIRKDGFKDHPIIPEGLDLVEEEDQFTHMLPLEDDYNTEDVLSKNARTQTRKRDQTIRSQFTPKFPPKLL